MQDLVSKISKIVVGEELDTWKLGSALATELFKAYQNVTALCVCFFYLGTQTIRVGNEECAAAIWINLCTLIGYYYNMISQFRS